MTPAHAVGPTQSPSAWEAPYLRPQSLVTIASGRRLNLVCLGDGSPTVVLDAGFGNDSLVWRKVQPLLARHTRVCAFDRAGERFSDPGPIPRDVLASVTDLHELILAADIARPFVLVGHSLGGMDALLYADRYPRELAGLVLLDPGVAGTKDKFVRLTHSAEAVRRNWTHFTACAHAAETRDKDTVLSCAKQSDLTDSEFSEALNTVQLGIAAHPYLWRTLRSESEVLESTGKPTQDDHILQRAARNLGDLPIKVIMRDEASVTFGMPPNIGHQVWTVVQNADAGLAKLSSRGELVLFKGSSHWVQLDQPEETARVIFATVNVPNR